MKVLVVILDALRKGHVGDHQNRGFMMQSAFLVTRKCAILKGDENSSINKSRHSCCRGPLCYKIYTKVKTKECKHECEKTDRDEWYQIDEKRLMLVFLTISELTSFPTRKLYQ